MDGVRAQDPPVEDHRLIDKYMDRVRAELRVVRWRRRGVQCTVRFVSGSTAWGARVPHSTAPAVVGCRTPALTLRHVYRRVTAPGPAGAETLRAPPPPSTVRSLRQKDPT